MTPPRKKKIIFSGTLVFFLVYILIYTWKISIGRHDFLLVNRQPTETFPGVSSPSIPTALDSRRHYLVYPRDLSGRTRNETLPPLNEAEIQDSVKKVIAKCEKSPRPSEQINTTRRLCECHPNTLVGRFNGSFEVTTLEELHKKYSDIARGGHWSPLNCTARERIAIIIPYKDRSEHMLALLNVLHPFLRRQQLEYRIFVAEQVTPAVFNKAATMNSAFLEAKKLYQFDCVFFHDVDMLPQDDRNLYTCAGVDPLHVGAFIDKYDYRIGPGALFGGVTAFTPHHFRLINGFSNRYYGWGGEDDDILKRLRTSGLRVSRGPRLLCRYTMQVHKRDKANPYNQKRRKTYAKAWKDKDYMTEGLNTIQYELLKIDFQPLFTRIEIQLPEAPADSDFLSGSSR